MDLIQTIKRATQPQPSDATDLATTLLIIWLLDKPLASVVSQLKITEHDLITGINSKSNPLKRFLLVYMSILRKSASAITLQAQYSELKSLIKDAKALEQALEKRGLYLPLPLDLNYLENLADAG